MKKNTIIIIVVIVAIIGIFFIIKGFSKDKVVVPTENTSSKETTDIVASSTINTVPIDKTMTVIGKSVEGRDINAFHFGKGSSEILFVGGIHGGYEWNTALLAYQVSDYLKNNESIIPENLKVTVIPVLNPDGLNKAVGTTTGNFSIANVPKSEAETRASRFNANDVDLNRNFECDWKAEGVWQNKKVSGGSSAFSEPESLAVKNYIETSKPISVIVWYSAAGGVYSSNCHNGVLPETDAITKVYADASGYPSFKSFDFYAITGDMVNWLAKKGVPAISVLLTNHTETEFTKNQAGIKAILKYYTK